MDPATNLLLTALAAAGSQVLQHTVQFRSDLAMNRTTLLQNRFSTCFPTNESVYNIVVESINGSFVDLSAFRDRLLLIVNTATYSEHANQYYDFNELLEEYGGHRLNILLFPCNQFRHCEPGKNSEILNGLRYVRPGNNFTLHPNIYVFAKIDVNGNDQHSLYSFLEAQCPQTVKELARRNDLSYDPVKITDVTDNFEKFLLDKHGRPRYRFHATSWFNGTVVKKNPCGSTFRTRSGTKRNNYKTIFLGPVNVNNPGRYSSCLLSNTTVYNFAIQTLNGNYVNLSQYRGQVLLIVNVASFCSFTMQYLDFPNLLDLNMNSGFTIIGFPCNQFALQEPSRNDELLNTIRFVRPGNNYIPHQNLHIFGKLNVNGDNEHQLYTFMKSICPQTTTEIGKRENMVWNPVRATDITWNFEKFLVDRRGRVRYRFHPTAWGNGEVVAEETTCIYFNICFISESEKLHNLNGVSKCFDSNQTIYTFKVQNLNDEYVDLKQYKGKPLLIINVATFCTFTEQYLDFNPLLDKYNSTNLQIVAFPCNQFHFQEPAGNNEILNGVMFVRPGHGWKPHKNLHIYGKLENQCPQTVDTIGSKDALMYDVIRPDDITWNFEKFLVDREGKVRYRFHPKAWEKGRTVESFIDSLS
uniref:Glutathione peroxidase n=1 Tax=Syphacia muris TaxID=451379 RepID=A0A158R5L6_9BILA